MSNPGILIPVKYTIPSMISTKGLLFFLSHLLLLFTACGPDVLLDTEHSLPENGWSQTDTLTFRFEITDTLALYDIYLTAEHETSYPNQNFYVRVFTEFPNGALLDQTLSLELAGAAGRWYGDCNDEQCDFEVAVQRNAFFNQYGEHRIRVVPYVRRELVPEIESFGIRVEVSDDRRK